MSATQVTLMSVKFIILVVYQLEIPYSIRRLAAAKIPKELEYVCGAEGLISLDLSLRIGVSKDP